ncbi:hypothetical protein PSTT_00401 [Puccinia striiformis]|uniref:Uncharacterized protein n=1 Tax=Puccinia striiformis TaxID=27350 RepID=A0A2S4W7U0_9BASI|nr:hypothetical protein PSTT_00401 [Puccinia striiformis]
MSRSISRVSALIKHHRSATGKTASILNKSIPSKRLKSCCQSCTLWTGVRSTRRCVNSFKAKVHLTSSFPISLRLGFFGEFWGSPTSPEQTACITTCANNMPLVRKSVGMGNSLFVATGAGIVGLALYHAYVPSSAEDEESILTRYGPPSTLLEPHSLCHLAQLFPRDTEAVKKTEAHNMAVVFDASDKAFFKASVERPTIRRLANAGNFGIASPYGVVPGTSTDFSDLVIKSPRDDLRRPEDVKLSHPKSN